MESRGGNPMLWAARQLVVPINYLRIRHGETLFRSKAVYDFVLPIILTLATVIVFVWLSISLRLFDHQEVIKRLNDLLTLMIVFYMAALAAVATFDRAGIDDTLKGGDATLRVLHHDTGEHVVKALTYRQFISYLFGYLSFLSLCLYVFILIFAIGWPALENHFICSSVHWYLENIFDPVIFTVVFFCLWQLVITSLLGIHFLTERIQSLYEDTH
jgi:hypothetical protein